MQPLRVMVCPPNLIENSKLSLTIEFTIISTTDYAIINY